jgi:hypothetical protein
VAYRTILVELAYDSGLEARLQVALILAKRYYAVLIGMHVMPPPFILTPYVEAAAFMGPTSSRGSGPRIAKSETDSKRLSRISAETRPMSSGGRLRGVAGISWPRPPIPRTWCSRAGPRPGALMYPTCLISL